MKKLFSIPLFFLLLFAACNDNDDSEYTLSNGLVIGADMRLCMCCGGWWIEINKDTLRLMNAPSEFNEQMIEMEMPVPVALEWKPMTDGCGRQFTKLIEVKNITISQ